MLKISRSICRRNWLNDIIPRSFVTRSASIIDSTFVSIVLLRSANRTAEMLSVITGRTIASSSSHRFTRITVISDKDHNNLHSQHRKTREIKDPSACFKYYDDLDDPRMLQNFHGSRVSRRKEIPAGVIRTSKAETVRIPLKFHYDLLARVRFYMYRRVGGAAFSESQFMRIG